MFKGIQNFNFFLLTTKAKNPQTWVNAIDATALYTFNGETQSELSIKAGQQIKIAPKEVQQMNRLLSTNWLLATCDGKNVGVVPINYIKRLDCSQAPTIEVADLTMEPVLIKDDTKAHSEESTC